MFRGLSAFPVTPMDQQGRVNTDELRLLLGRLGAAGVDSVGLLGSTGSYMFLSRAERRRAIEAAADSLAKRTPLIVGAGAMRTDDAQMLARDAKAAGADGLLLAPVSYTPLNENEVFEHFMAVASVTDLPLCIYNNPGTTRFSFSNALVARLANDPRIVAVKNPALPQQDMLASHHALVSELPVDFAVGYSGDWHAAEAILAGGVAWYSVVGGLLPEPTLKLMRAAQKADAAEVARINGLFEPLWHLFRELSSYRVIHAAANILGLTQAQPPKPILPLALADRSRVSAALGVLDGI